MLISAVMSILEEFGSLLPARYVAVNSIKLFIQYLRSATKFTKNVEDEAQALQFNRLQQMQKNCL